MENIVKNKGVIIFYLLLILMTFVIINANQRNLSMESDYVYLMR